MNAATKPLIALLAGLGLAACASQPVPEAELALARDAVQDARAAGAGELASPELISAQAHLAEAQAAVRAERYDQARRHAEIAAVDAELAEARARSQRAQLAAQELQQGIDVLRQELARGEPESPGGFR